MSKWRKAENELELEAQNLQKTALEKYKAQNKSHHAFEAASRLWVLGMPWAQALQIVEEALSACIRDDG